jgi:hypothetical protein
MDRAQVHHVCFRRDVSTSLQEFPCCQFPSWSSQLHDASLGAIPESAKYHLAVIVMSDNGTLESAYPFQLRDVPKGHGACAMHWYIVIQTSHVAFKIWRMNSPIPLLSRRPSRIVFAAGTAATIGTIATLRFPLPWHILRLF